MQHSLMRGWLFKRQRSILKQTQYEKEEKTFNCFWR